MYKSCGRKSNYSPEANDTPLYSFCKSNKFSPKAPVPEVIESPRAATTYGGFHLISLYFRLEFSYHERTTAFYFVK